MIGNDIVDLKQAKLENSWQRKGYLEKVLTKEELSAFEQVSDTQKDIKYWQLWSMKEAVYKIVSRMENRRFFAPKRFICPPLTPLRGNRPCNYFSLGLINSNLQTFSTNPSPLKGVRGYCQYQNETFLTQTYYSKNHLHTIASFQNSVFKNLHFQTFQIPKTDYSTQSKTTHEKLILKYSEFSNLPKSHLKIQKNQLGIPNLYFKNEQLPVQISMSHHGSWGGLVIKLNENE